MSIDIEVFADQMEIMGVRFNKVFTTVVRDRYYESFNERLSTEQFKAMCDYLFDCVDSEVRSFPSPREFIDLARQLVPDPALAPSPVDTSTPETMVNLFPKIAVQAEPIDIPEGLEGAAKVRYMLEQTLLKKELNW